MEKLFSLFNAMAAGSLQVRDFITTHGQKLYAGFQALESCGHSKAYHVAKTTAVCGLFVTSLLTLNFEGAIASGIGIGDEINFLERLPTDPSGPRSDIT